MSYKRKTCECCRKRLQGDESYWCDDCRAGVTRAYDATLAVLLRPPRQPVDTEALVETLAGLLQRMKDAAAQPEAAQSPVGSKIQIKLPGGYRVVSENT